MIKVGPFHFIWWPTLVTLLVILCLVKLGLWQLERADEKRALFTDFASTEVRPTPLESLSINQLPQRFEAVSATVTLDPERYFLRDNQVLDGKVGYHVIAIAHQPQSTPLLAVNLGWIAAPIDRQQLPQVTLPSTPVTLTGRWYVPDQQAFQLGEANYAEGGWPKRIQHFEFAPLANQLQLEFWLGMVLVEHPLAGVSPPLVQAWKPQVMAPEKHQAYALQWFSLALAAAVVFLFASRQKSTSTPSKEE